MIRIAAASAALMASTAWAQAGGVERSGQSMGILFEAGNYVELSYSFVDPSVSGTAGGGALSSGDMAASYTQIELRYHQKMSDSLSFALIVDQPIGANVAYPTGTGYPFAGANGTIDSQAFSALIRHELANGLSIYGGLRAVSANGNVSLPTYRLSADGSTELGYTVGAAYEIPEIAMRVSLTYQSATKHDFTGTETYLTPALGTLPTAFKVTIPKSLTLEAQTGVAEGTLVFGSARWVDWTEFRIQGSNATAPSPILVDYDHDTITYTLGGARRLNDQLALLGSVSYEAQAGSFTGNLGPTDGRTSFSLAARHDNGPWRILAGVNYSIIGDARTETTANSNTLLGTFTNNTALGFGLRVGYSF
jgi:long-subunit fatty acid transport protein